MEITNKAKCKIQLNLAYNLKFTNSSLHARNDSDYFSWSSLILLITLYSIYTIPLSYIFICSPQNVLHVYENTQNA